MFTKGQLDDFRKQITTELAAIEATMKAEGSPNVVELDQTRVGRLSRMDALQQQAMASGIQERLLRKKRRLDAALTRMDADEFGFCCQCGESISLGRLQADLGAPFCSGCQEEIDGRRTSV